MLAYHNDPKTKLKYVNRMKAHIKADELIQGTGYEDGKGCAVGCTLNKYEHNAFPDELGYPVELAYLQDAIFEGLSEKSVRQDFALEFLDIVEPGADLSKVINKFYVWLLVDKEDGVIQYAADRQTKDAIRRVAFLNNKAIKGVRVRKRTWAAAGAAARDAAGAARAAGDAAAWAARDAAGAAAAWAARAAGDAAAWAAGDAAGDAAYEKMAGKLIELLGENNVGGDNV